MHAEEAVDERLGPRRADHFEVVFARQPPGLQEGEQRRDVVEVVVCQEDRRDALVAGLGGGEPLEDPAPAVDEEGPVAVVEEVPGLHAFGHGHRAA